MLHPDVVLIGDSNGKARTTRQIMVGADKVMRFFQGLLRKYQPGAFDQSAPMLVNGDLGFYIPPVSEPQDGYPAVDAVSIRDGKIVAIYDIANPDKLTRLTNPVS